jgi:hypothetical protein
MTVGTQDTDCVPCASCGADVPVCGICHGNDTPSKRHLVSIRKLQSAMKADIVTLDFAEKLASIYVIRKFEGKAWRASFTYAELDGAFQDRTLVEAFRERAVQYEY